jgi:hypothetical protein
MWRSDEVDEDEDEQRSGEVDEGARAADLGDGKDEDVEAAASVRCAWMGELRGPAVMETMQSGGVVAVCLSGEWKRYGRGRRRRGNYIGGTFSPGWSHDPGLNIV